MPFVIFVSLFLSLSFSSPAFAETLSPLIVEDTPIEGVSIPGHEWEVRGGQAESVLSASPGISFTRYGGPGQARSVLLRGARAEDTLVLLDGIPLNDSSSPSRAFDFSQLPTTDLDRIEILKGPQSVLYGSDAMGGVIQFFTRRQSDRSSARVEGGSYGTLRARAAHLGFHAGYEKSDGFSAADVRDGNSEKDGHRAWNLGGTQEVPLDARTQLRVQGLYQRAKTDTDASGGFGGDRVGTFTQNSQLLFRSEIFHLSPEGYEWLNAGSLFAREREDNTMGPAFYRSNLWKVESRVKKTFGAHTPTLGVEFQEESGRSSEISARQKFRAGAIFAHNRIESGRWETNFGGRLSFHSQTSRATNFGLGAGYWIFPDRLKWKANFGSGFKAPSLYQTYSSFGSLGLKPSRSLGLDTGFVFTGNGWGAELGVYANRFRELIDFDSVRMRYFNIGRASTRGIETALHGELGDFRLTNAFTTIHAIDQTTRNKLPRRPGISNTLELAYARGEKYGAASDLRYVGRREDVHPTAFPRQTVPMPSFFTAGANFFYRLSPTWRLNLRGENLLNRHYQETSGFGVPGRSGYLALESSW